LTRHLMRSAGRATGLLSTVGYELPDGVLRQPPHHFTTPEAPQVQQILRDMVDAGASHAVVEASSHALALDRVRAVDFDVAIWTNLTGEHLDFHGTMEQYFADKALLVRRARHAVLNADDPWTEQLLPLAPVRTTYSAEGRPADWRASDVVEGPGDLRFTVHSPEGDAAAVLPMIGRFNVANALAAMAGAHSAGVPLAALVAGLATFGGVAGRMEMVEREDGDPRVIVDFAHTPPSLEKALETVRVTPRSGHRSARSPPGWPTSPSSPRRTTATPRWRRSCARWSAAPGRRAAPTSSRSGTGARRSATPWARPVRRTPSCSPGRGRRPPWSGATRPSTGTRSARPVAPSPSGGREPGRRRSGSGWPVRRRRGAGRRSRGEPPD